MVNDFEVKIIVYLRRQDQYIESMYTQRIHEGITASFEEFKKHYGIYDLAWNDLLTPYVDLFGRNNIIIRPYEKRQLKDGNAITDFFDLIGIPADKIVYIKRKSLAKITNSGYSRAALEVARHMNSILGEDERIRMRLLLQATNFKKPFENYTFFSQVERRKLIEHYQDSNLKIAETFLGRKNEILFLDDVKDIATPENDHVQKDLGVEQVAEVLMRIFISISQLEEFNPSMTIRLIKRMETFLLNQLNNIKKIRGQEK